MFYKEQAVLCSDLLKQHTKNAHAATEAILIQQLKKIRSINDYSRVLQMFEGFFAPLYHTIYQYIDEKILLDIHERRSAVHITNDLRALGIYDSSKKCSLLPAVNNRWQALGALYVLEGSTLGGVVIANMLKANAHFEIRDACLNFFNGYGENNRVMWNRFKAALNSMVQDENETEEVIAAANDTFEKLKFWIQTCFL